MPPFTSEELRYYVKASRTSARDLIFHLHDHSRNTLGMTAPVGAEVSRVLLTTLEDIDSNIHDGNKTGTLPAIAFLDVLRDNNIVQSREQGDALVTAFGDWLRDVDYLKWWRSLGVEAPSDYMDPELLFDTLPQPFRTIMKVLEQDILDAAWEIIARRHPEVSGGGKGNGPRLELENTVEGTAIGGLGNITALCGVGGRASEGFTPALSTDIHYADLTITGSADGNVDVVRSTGDIMASISITEVLSSSSGSILISQDVIDGLGGITSFSDASDSRKHPVRFALTMADFTQNENGTKKEEGDEEDEEEKAAALAEKEKEKQKKSKAKKGGKNAASKEAEPPPPPPPVPKVKSMVVVLEYWPPTAATTAVAGGGGDPVTPLPGDNQMGDRGGSGGSDRSSGSGGGGAMRRRSITGPSPLSLGGVVAEGYVASTPERVGSSTSSRKRSLSSPAQPAINAHGGAGGSARITLSCAGMIEGEAPLSRLTLSPDGCWLGLSGADGSFTLHALPPRPNLVKDNDGDATGKKMDKIDEERNEAEDNDEGHSSSSLSKVNALPLPPPFVALPPPPPPPTFMDPKEVANEEGDNGESASASLPGGVSKPKGKGEEGGEPDPPKEVKPPPEIYARDESLVARCFFLQGIEEGGVGRRDCGSERIALHMSAFALWRPASNVIRKFTLPAPSRVSKLLSLIAHIHTVQPNAAKSLMSRDSSRDEGVALISSDEDAVEIAVADMSGDVRLVSEFTFASPITCVALTPSDGSGLGPSSLLLNLAAIGTQKGSVVLWDMDMGCLRSSLGDHHAPITNLVFTSVIRYHNNSGGGGGGGGVSSGGSHTSHHRSHNISTVNSRRPQHAMHTTHRPSHLQGGEEHHHPLPKHHPSFIQAHHHAGSAAHPHEQISHGVVRLVSTSADGVVHLWATMPHRVNPRIDKNKPGTRNQSQRQGRGAVGVSRSEPHGLHADPSPVLHYDQDDGSGILEPILLKTSQLNSEIVWVGCPSEAALMVAQTTTHLVVFDLEELTLVGALGFETGQPPIAACDALGPAFRKPLGCFLAGLPVYFPSSTASDNVNIDNDDEELPDDNEDSLASYETSSKEGEVPTGKEEKQVEMESKEPDRQQEGDTASTTTPSVPPPLETNAAEVIRSKKWSLCCSGSGVTVVCSTDALRHFGIEDAKEVAEREKEAKRKEEEKQDLFSVGQSDNDDSKQDKTAPPSVVLRFSCANLASLCPGVAQWMKYNGHAIEDSFVVDAFKHLTPAQRKDPLQVDESTLHHSGRPQSASTAGGGSTGGDGLGGAARAMRRRSSSRQSMNSERLDRHSTASSGGGDRNDRRSSSLERRLSTAEHNIHVGELTAENLKKNSSKLRDSNVLGFNQRFLPSSVYVLKEISSRRATKKDRESLLLARRQELLAMLPA